MTTPASTALYSSPHWDVIADASTADYDIVANDPMVSVAMQKGRLCREITVLGSGDLEVTRADGTNKTFSGLQAGAVLPIAAAAIVATGSTATNVIVSW